MLRYRLQSLSLEGISFVSSDAAPVKLSEAVAPSLMGI